MGTPSCNSFSLLTICEKSQREMCSDANAWAWPAHSTANHIARLGQGTHAQGRSLFFPKKLAKRSRREKLASFSRGKDPRTCPRLQEQPGMRSQHRHCSVFHSSPQTGTLRQRLNPPLFPLSNYTIYFFSSCNQLPFTQPWEITG